MGLEHGTWGIKVDQKDFTSASLSRDLKALIARDSDGGDAVSLFYVAAQKLSASLKAHPKRALERAGDIFERSLREVVLHRSFGMGPLASIPRVRRMTTLEYLSPYILFVCLCLVVFSVIGLCLFGALSLLVRFLMRSPVGACLGRMRSRTKEKGS